MEYLGPSRRSALTTLALGVVSGCSSFRSSPFWGTVLNFNKSAGPVITQATVAATRYASMIAYFKGGAKALLILGEYRPQNRLEWFSAERQSVTTWGPFVTRILGTEVELRDTHFGAGWDVSLSKLTGRRLERTVLFVSKGKSVAVTHQCQFEGGGLQAVDLLSGSRQLRLIREHVVADRRHRHTNSYWVDEDGFCWKSSQLVIPTMPPFETEITRRTR